MDSRKLILMYPVFLVALVCLIRTVLNVIQEMSMDRPESTILAVLLLPTRSIDELEIFYVTDSLVQVVFRSLSKSTMYIIMAEILRSFTEQILFEDSSMSITMTYNGSDDEVFHNFYWNMIQNHAPKRIWCNYTFDSDEVYIIKCRKLLRMLTVRYDRNTRSWSTITTPRIFGWN